MSKEQFPQVSYLLTIQAIALVCLNLSCILPKINEKSMWHWDQGRLEYFQFDALRQISSYVINNNFKAADKSVLTQATGLRFAAPLNYSPWRNYSRVLKLTLLVSEENNIAVPTPVAKLLATPGAVTCDEYLHFLSCTFSEPSPALAGWTVDANFRFPLLFALKYLLTKTVITSSPIASLNEIIGAYSFSDFKGDEDQEEFISIVNGVENYEQIALGIDKQLLRQAKESLKVISQISYLHVQSDVIVVSLHPSDAHEIFDDLYPLSGSRSSSSNDEIKRIASLFKGGSTSIAFEYPNTIIETVIESGFKEGNKIKRTHITIERNVGLRTKYFDSINTTICDVCKMDTKKTYPWSERILDIHHLLPLSSGTRVEGKSTTFNDLVAVCPNCHRAIHRYYDIWLAKNNRKDFINSDEAKRVYHEMKTEFKGLII